MSDQTTLSNQAWALLLTLACIWGASFLSIRIALDEIAPLTSVLHRVGWACVLLWLVVIWRGHALPRTRRVWVSFLVMGALNNVIPFSLMAWGQVYVETGLTSIFNAATAVWGVLLASMFFADEQLTPRKLLGACLGLFGVAIAIGLESVLSFDIRSLAQMAILIGTLSYGLAGVWARKRLTGLPPELAAAGMLTGAFLVMVPLTLWIDGVPRFDLEPRTWLAIFYYALIATALAYLIYYRILALAGSGNLLLVTLLIPPVAITLGAVVRGEALLPQAYAGFALLALGLVILDGRLFRRRAEC